MSNTYNCYWYAEDRDMSATFCYCRLFSTSENRYPLPCQDEEDFNCQHHILKKEADKVIKVFTAQQAQSMK